MIALILTSYLGVFAYIIFQGRGMAERKERAKEAHDDLRRIAGFSVADEIDKLDKLRKSGSITGEEFTRLPAKLVQ